MKNVLIGYNVTQENAKESATTLMELKEYMNEYTKGALVDEKDGLYLFNGETKYLMYSSVLLEADVEKEAEESGMEYISLRGYHPSYFVSLVKRYLSDPCSFSDDSTNTDPTVSVKNDRKDHKVRWDLIPMEPINEIAKVYTAGAVKYGPDRWQNLENGFNRYRGAACRHLFEYMQGNRYDKETKCMHLAQAAWNLIAMIWLDMHGKGLFPFEEDKSQLEELLKTIREEHEENKAAFERTSQEVKTVLLNNAEEKKKSDAN